MGEIKGKRAKTYTSKCKVICQSSGELKKHKHTISIICILLNLRSHQQIVVKHQLLHLHWNYNINDEFQNEPIQIQGNSFVTYFHVTILTIRSSYV